MKKIIIATMLAVTSTVVLAAALPTSGPAQTLPWVLRVAGETWRIANPTGTTHIAFTVAPNGPGGAPSDPVRLVCDTTQIVAPGKTGTCVASSFRQATFVISSFKNGSQGTYTVT
jgi:hypothetical protein